MEGAAELAKWRAFVPRQNGDWQGEVVLARRTGEGVLAYAERKAADELAWSVSESLAFGHVSAPMLRLSATSISEHLLSHGQERNDERGFRSDCEMAKQYELELRLNE